MRRQATILLFSVALAGGLILKSSVSIFSGETIPAPRVTRDFAQDSSTRSDQIELLVLRRMAKNAMAELQAKAHE
jgi:hypothetical protein